MKRLIMLAALPALLLAGCAAQPAASGTETLTVTGSYPLQYAQQFTIDECEGGYYLITIDGTRYLVVPEGENAPAELDADITVLQQPIESIYLVSSSAMDPIISIDGLDTVALSGTQADNWYLDAAKTAMENGQIAYAGKYSAPDYEAILAANCGLAIENTMIYHTPEVKEQLEKFGVPVLVERSSYESGPLARMEWVKLYGVLLGKTDEAEQVFDDAVQRIAPLENESATGKTVAFFSITSNNLATVRKGGDYVAKMIEMAGLCILRPDGQRQQPGHRQHLAGGFLRRGQGRRCADLQQHHRGRDTHDGRVDRQMPAAGTVQGRAAGQRLVHRAKPFPAKHGDARPDPGHE